jgi:hypothetical protein
MYHTEFLSPEYQNKSTTFRNPAVLWSSGSGASLSQGFSQFSPLLDLNCYKKFGKPQMNRAVAKMNKFKGEIFLRCEMCREDFDEPLGS